MNVMELLDPGGWLTSAFYAVLRASLMAIPVIVLVIAVRLLLRNRLPSQWTYALWLLVPLRLLLPWTPDSSISIYNVIHMPALSTSTTNTPLTASSNTVIGNTATETATSFIPEYQAVSGNWASNDERLPDTPAFIAANNINEKVAAIEQIRPNNESAPSSYVLSALTWIWLAGAAIAIAVIARANVRFAQELRLYAAELHDPVLNERLKLCMRLLGIRRRVAIYRTDRVTSPALTGIVRPKLLLPASIVPELDERQLRHILLHELSHLKRNDLYVNAAMQLLLAVHWFNPLLYYAYSRMREDQELACDSLALSRLHAAERRDYALTLIHLLECWPSNKPGRLVTTANMLGNRLFWRRRIEMIQARTRSSLRRSLFGMAALALIAGCALTGGKADKPVIESREPSMENEALASIKPASVTAEPDTKPAMQLLASTEGANLYGEGTEVFDPDFKRRLIRYDKLTVEMSGRSYTYPWKLLTSSMRQIKLNWADVDRDGEDELIIIMTGEWWNKDEVGARRDSVHIIRPQDGSEIEVADPVAAVKAKYKPSLSIKDGIVDVFLDMGASKLHMPLGETNFGSSQMSETVYLDRYVYADYFQDKLWVWVGGSLSDNQSGVTTFTTFLVQYEPDMTISSISISDLDSWEHVE